MNFISMQVKTSQCLVHPEFTLNLPEVWADVLQPYQGQTLTLGIRPEHLDLASEDLHHIPVQVELVEALGHETYLSLHLTHHTKDGTPEPLIARVNPYQQVAMGEQLWFSIQLDKIHLFDNDTEAAIRPTH